LDVLKRPSQMFTLLTVFSWEACRFSDHYFYQLNKIGGYYIFIFL